MSVQAIRDADEHQATMLDDEQRRAEVET